MHFPETVPMIAKSEERLLREVARTSQASCQNGGDDTAFETLDIAEYHGDHSTPPALDSRAQQRRCQASHSDRRRRHVRCPSRLYSTVALALYMYVSRTGRMSHGVFSSLMDTRQVMFGPSIFNWYDAQSTEATIRRRMSSRHDHESHVNSNSTTK